MVRCDRNIPRAILRASTRVPFFLASKSDARSARYQQVWCQLNALATIPDTDEAVSVKPKRIPPKISQIVDWLVTGACKSQQAACDRANLDPSYVSRELRKVHVRVFMERRARETIANGTMRASARLVELLDAGSEHVSLDASKHMLAIAGIKPTQDAQVSVNIDIKAGYVIDLTDDRPMRTVGQNMGSKQIDG